MARRWPRLRRARIEQGVPGQRSAQIRGQVEPSKEHSHDALGTRDLHGMEESFRGLDEGHEHGSGMTGRKGLPCGLDVLGGPDLGEHQGVRCPVDLRQVGEVGPSLVAPHSVDPQGQRGLAPLAFPDERQRVGPGFRLRRWRDGVLEVDAGAVGSGRDRLGVPVGPVTGREEEALPRGGSTHHRQYERGIPSTCSPTKLRMRLLAMGATKKRRASRNFRSMPYSTHMP